MDDEITIVIKNWVAIVAAIIGLILGLYNFFAARGSEKRKKIEDDEDWAFYVSLLKNQKQTSGESVFTPELGSKEHKIFERLVSKGLAIKTRIGSGIGFSVLFKKNS